MRILSSYNIENGIAVYDIFQDEKSIKLDFKRETKSQLFQEIFKISDGNEDNSDNNNNSFDDFFGEVNPAKSVVANGDNSPKSAAMSCKYS